MPDVGGTYFDFNDIPSFSGGTPRYNIEDINEGLKRHAETWARRYFINGRISEDGKYLRLADISGRAPRNKGSCVISLKGEQAGCWFDHSTGQGGGPFQTFMYATGLHGAELFELAAQICGLSKSHTNGVDHKNLANGHANGHAEQNGGTSNVSRKKQIEIEIEDILSRSVPLDSTIAERWLQTRGLSLPNTEDLLFNPDVTDWEAKMSRPAMIAKVRGPDGQFNGCIHRTYLNDDGTAKAQMENARKTLGEPKGGAIRLFSCSDILGVAEGIETAMAATMLTGVSCWSVLSSSGLLNFKVPTDVKPKCIIVFADAGNAGERTARALAYRLMQEGIETDVRLPEFGDDFNHDLMVKLGIVKLEVPVIAPQIKEQPKEEPLRNPEVTAQNLVLAHDSAPSSPREVILQRIAKLKEASEALITIDDVRNVIIDMSFHNFDPLDERMLIGELKSASGLSLNVLTHELRKHRNEYGPKRRKRKAPAWVNEAICSPDGMPKSILSNAILAFREDEDWRGLLGFDEFAQKVVVRGPLPWERDGETIDLGVLLNYKSRSLQDNDVYGATNWLQESGVFAPSNVVREALVHVASFAKFNPVKEYLLSLKWDKKPRLATWLAYYAGAEPGGLDDVQIIPRYLDKIGTAWMISAVARIFEPGCQADYVLVFEGPQGKKKSSLFRILGGEWFSDDMKDFSREGQMQIQGRWIVEFSELDAYRRSEMTQVKAFITRRIDVFRSPYGFFPMDHPRQTIFSGTTNELEWLKDDTGGRRWWPVKCGMIDVDALKHDRDQLWAEAVARYQAKEPWWLSEEDEHIAKEQQEARQPSDAWLDKIVEYLDNLTADSDVTLGAVLHGALGMDASKWNKFDQGRVTNLMRRIGWERYKAVNKAGRPWRWRKVGQVSYNGEFKFNEPE